VEIQEMMIRYRDDNGETSDLNALAPAELAAILSIAKNFTQIFWLQKGRWFMEVPDDAQLEQTLQEFGKLYTPRYPRSDNDFRLHHMF
jgi:hypothetical protein